MKVKLIAKTVPIIDGINTLEEFIAYCARVSNPDNQLNTKTSGKLLKYLINNKHWSPFEMVNLVFEIETTRDISRQLLRHGFKFQEFSQRYSKVKDFSLREARLQDHQNRQNSVETDDEYTKERWKEIQEDLLTYVFNLYDLSLSYGIAKEQARAILPEGLITSILYTSGTLRNWMHYCQLRTKNETQKEHRLIAEEVKKILIEEFPSLEI